MALIDPHARLQQASVNRSSRRQRRPRVADAGQRQAHIDTAPRRIDGYRLSYPAALGDVNGDGYADILSGPGSTQYVYFGSANPTPTIGATLVTPPDDIAAKADAQAQAIINDNLAAN